METHKNPVRISVVMTTYNGVKYVGAQIDSILAQTELPCEIIIRDDGSTDQTWELLQEYAQKNRLVKPHRNENNMGLNQNFLAGFFEAEGNYIAICDQDDVWEKNRLEIYREAFEQEKLTLAYSDSWICDSRLNVKYRYHGRDECTVYDQIWWGLAPGHAIVFRKDILYTLHNIKEIDFIYEWLIGLAATCKGKIKKLDIPLTLHRRHEANVTDHKYRPEDVKYKSPLKLFLHVMRFLYSGGELSNFKWQFSNISLILQNYEDKPHLKRLNRFLRQYHKETLPGMLAAPFLYFLARNDLDFKNRIKALYTPLYKYYFYKRDGAGLRGRD